MKSSDDIKTREKRVEAKESHRGHDLMVVGFITTYAYHYELLNTTLCDKVCQ
jgi:hypothetical protein